MKTEGWNTEPRLILDTLRFVFISPQMLIAVVMIVVPADALWTTIGEKVVAGTGLGPALVIGIPCSLVATTIGLFWKTVFPSRNADLLRASPVYRPLRNRALFGVGLCAMAVVIVLVCVFVGGHWEPGAVGFAYSIAVSLSAVTTCSMFLAAYKARELLDSYDDAPTPPA